MRPFELFTFQNHFTESKTVETFFELFQVAFTYFLNQLNDMHHGTFLNSIEFGSMLDTKTGI